MSIRNFIAVIALAISAPAWAQQAQKLDSTRVQWAAQWLDRFTQEGMQKTGVPGVAVAIVYKDQVAYLKGFGVRKAGEAATVDANTVFQVGGLSEPMAATALAAMVQYAYLGWDDQIKHLDPEFKLLDTYVSDQLTIRDLFSHRSGIPANAGNLLQDLGYHQAEILTRLRLLPLGEFRENFSDTDFGFTEGAIAAALAYGDTWENLMQAELFQPLGMKLSSTEYAQYSSASNRAVLHVPVDGKLTPKYFFDDDAAAPAGGVNSTASDMAQWLMLYLNEGKLKGQPFIAPFRLSETYLPQIMTGFNSTTNRPQFYGLGWNVEYTDTGKLRLWQSGELSRGASSNVTLYPEDQIGIIVLTNAAPTGLAEAMADGFFDVLYNGFSITGQLSQDWLAVESARAQQKLDAAAARITDYSKLERPNPPAPPTLPLSAYVGTYRSNYYGDLDVQITPGGTGLAIVLGVQKIAYTLAHWNRDIFTYNFDGASQPSGRRGAIFVIGANNAVQQVRVDNFSAVEGNDVFKPVAADSTNSGSSAPSYLTRLPLVGRRQLFRRQ